MCGLGGSINFKVGDVNSFLTTLKHRGPDNQTKSIFKNIVFFHTRLAIQDIKGGCQPFETDNYIMVFNGEIYNHVELRKSLLKEIKFKTNSDTETLLCLYIKYNKRALSFIDGMYAFAILDKKRNKIIFARDRAGKKPLYIYKNKNQLLFSSELNSLKSILGNVNINEESIVSYLRCGFFFKDLTPYSNIFELEPSTLYFFDIPNFKFKKEKYFKMLDYYKNQNNFKKKEALSLVDNALHKSVKNRLISSDLEVGAFLSGGIDSSLIVATASKYQKLKTFTVKFKDGFDESDLARLTAEKYNTDHHELTISINLKYDIENILLKYGEPFMDSSCIPSYYISKEAKKYVSVILNGDGADELFAGYRRYVPIVNNLLPIAKLFKFILPFLPNQKNKFSIYNYFYRLITISNKKGLEFYLSATNDIFEGQIEFKNSILKDIESYINQTNLMNISPLSKILLLDFKILLFSDLLPKMDIATMANSLEGRSPFLSKYFLELAPKIQDSLKVRGTITKYILRELAKKYIPIQLVSKPKRGFEVPLNYWVSNDLKEPIFDLLSSNAYCWNFIDKKYINLLMTNKLEISNHKRAKILWTLYCLEVWYKNQKIIS